MSDIYEQHKAAFASVSAYVILHNGERVATIAFKFPRGGAGRLFAYVHWLGVPMVRGFASGGGYDKASAAIANAVSKHKWAAESDAALAFVRALAKDDGWHWDRRLADSGFEVLQAV